MESIIISQKRLCVEIFWAFSTARFINSYWVQPGLDGNYFYWTIESSTSTSDKVQYKINRYDLVFNSLNACDIYKKFGEEWIKFCEQNQNCCQTP